MNNPLFNPKVVLLFVGFAIGLFALSILLYANSGERTSARSNRHSPDSYSVSAIGYAGVYDTMRRMHFPVYRGTLNPVTQAGSRGTLIVAEPVLHMLDGFESLKQTRRLLLVLPKWEGQRDPKKPAWLTEVELVNLHKPQQTLTLVDNGQGTVVRVPWPEQWTVNKIGITPQGQGTVQLIVSDYLRPVVGTPEGMLIGEKNHKNRIVWVLADPDVMNNQGFGKGDNAMFTLALIDQLRYWNNSKTQAPIIFDETSHGYITTKPEGLQLMLKFPFSIVVILVFMAALLLGFAGVRRFGAPKRPAAAQDFGKAGLIQNGARLLDYAGHHAGVMQRYVKMSIRAVGRSLHAPHNLSDAALAQWLDRVAKSRKIDKSCAEILLTTGTLNSNDRQTLTRLFKSAWDIYKWKGEILNGSAINRRHR